MRSPVLRKSSMKTLGGWEWDEVHLCWDPALVGIKILADCVFVFFADEFYAKYLGFPHSGLNLHTGSIECKVVHEVKLKNSQSWHLFHFVQRLYLHLQAVRLEMEKRNWILNWLNGLIMWKIKYHCFLPTLPELKWLFPEWLSFCWCWLPLSTLCLWLL